MDFVDKHKKYEIIIVDKGGLSLFGLTAPILYGKAPTQVKSIVDNVLDNMYAIRISLVPCKETNEVAIFGHAFSPIEVNTETVSACRSLGDIFDECVQR